MLVAAGSDYVFLWVLLGVAVILALTFYYQKKRSQDLEHVAQELGLQFQAEEEKAPLPDRTFDTLPLFRRSRRRTHFLCGRRALGEMFLADVRVGSGKNSYTQTVACFHLAERRLPAFELSPESWAHKIAQAFGYKDIDFESSPEFSKNYLLRGEDEDAVRGLFGADLRNFFTGEKGWTVEGAGDWLCAYRHIRTVSPKDIRSFLEQAEAVAQQFARGRW